MQSPNETQTKAISLFLEEVVKEVTFLAREKLRSLDPSKLLLSGGTLFAAILVPCLLLYRCKLVLILFESDRSLLLVEV